MEVDNTTPITDHGGNAEFAPVEIPSPDNSNEDIEPMLDTNTLTVPNESSGHPVRSNIFTRALKNLQTMMHVPHVSHGRREITEAETPNRVLDPAAVPGSCPGVSLAGHTSSKTPMEDLDPSLQLHDLMAKPDTSRHPPDTQSLGKTPSLAAADDDTPLNVEGGGDVPPWVLPEALQNSLVIILSMIYGITIVMMGLVLPLSEIFVDSDHPYFFEVFYLYLYSTSMAFLVYVYTYLLRKERLFTLSLPRTITKTLSRTFSRSSLPSVRSSSISERSSAPVRPLVRYASTLSSLSQRRKRKIAYNPEMSAHTGSFYLRIGVIGFGIGSMIHNGLSFGHYFEINHMANHCSDAVQAIKPFALLCFTFVQMYFIFMNSKMCIYKYKTLARFGLMHMSCTNICVWLRSIVLETLLAIKVTERQAYNALVETTQEDGAESGVASGGLGTTHNPEEGQDEDSAFVPELSCSLDAMMGKILESSSVYLYPCTIDYSLVCACVLYVMWSNVGQGLTAGNADSCSDVGTLDSEDESDEEKRGHNRMSVDCAGSSKGLFLGILLLVTAIVCIVCFFVLTSSSRHVTTGTLLGHVCEEIILLVTFLATVLASYQMSSMHFYFEQKVGLEEILTLISFSGLGLYGVWSITAALFYLDTMHGRLTLITNLFMLLQAGSQVAFTFLALRASTRNSQQLQSKPGRQCVTFLLLCNFALWAINTFETQRMEHNQTQVDFYGTTAWSIFSHISVPLGIYFRFHSTVNLSIVWKKAWKRKDTRHIKGSTTRHSA